MIVLAESSFASLGRIGEGDGTMRCINNNTVMCTRGHARLPCTYALQSCCLIRAIN